MANVTGRCACGAVRYSSSAEPVFAVECFCRDCQRASGGDRASAVVVPVDALTIEGEPRWYASLADSGTTVRRGFCPTCGSPLFATNERLSAFVSIKVASLDDPSGFAPAAQVWTASAPPWAQLRPGVASFPRGRPATR